MFEREWLPSAIAIGISYFDFWQMNPRIIKVMTEGYKKKKLERDEELWRAGLYNYIAFSTALANAFSKHGKQSYLEKPLLQESSFSNAQKEEMSEEKRKEMENQKLAMTLRIMQANFEIGKKRRERENAMENQRGELPLDGTEENPV